MVMVYLNSKIGINVCIINKPYKFEIIYSVRKPSDLFPKNCNRPLVYYIFLSVDINQKNSIFGISFSLWHYVW
jgi:hypothetical protein